MKKKTLLALLAVATLVLTGCGHSSAPSLSPLQARADSLGKFIVDANLASVARFWICDSTSVLVNANYRYYYLGTPISNFDFKFEPGSLVYPLFLAALEEIDSSVLLPAVYKRFCNYSVVDSRFIRDEGHLVDSVTIKEALTSNVAMVALLDEQFGHRREELINILNSHFEELSVPDSLDLYTDSVWYSFLQGHGFLVDMPSLIGCYRSLPSPIVNLLHRNEEDGIMGLPALVVDGYRVNAMYLGISDDDLIGLVILQGANIYAEYSKEIFYSLIKNKES